MAGLTTLGPISGQRPFRPLWRVVWICLLKEWHPGISCSLPLCLSRFLYHTQHSGTHARHWCHGLGTPRWLTVGELMCPKLSDRSSVGLAPCQQTYSASQVETWESRHIWPVWVPSRSVNSARSKSRAQLISRHCAPLGAEQSRGSLRTALVTDCEDLPAKGHHRMHPPSLCGWGAAAGDTSFVTVPWLFP